MKRRALLSLMLIPLVAPTVASAQSAASLSTQDQADIARIEAYLNTMKSLRARFLQVAPDGSTSTGQAWIERPGRLRFQYDPPSPILLVAGAGLVVYHDAQLEQTSNIPLSQTPLGILLRDDIKLSGDITVSSISRVPGQIQVTMYRTNSPGDGTLTLVFADTPLTLRQWAVVDSQRKETKVSLFDIVPGGHFDANLFYFVDPKLLGPNPGGTNNQR